MLFHFLLVINLWFEILWWMWIIIWSCGFGFGNWTMRKGQRLGWHTMKDDQQSENFQERSLELVWIEQDKTDLKISGKIVGTFLDWILINRLVTSLQSSHTTFWWHWSLYNSIFSISTFHIGHNINIKLQKHKTSDFKVQIRIWPQNQKWRTPEWLISGNMWTSSTGLSL